MEWKIKVAEATAKELFQQWNEPRSPPQGNTVMDAKEGLEPQNNTLRQKLVFSCGDQKAPYKFVSEEYRKRVARRVDQICENPDLLQAENPETERDKRDREEFGMYPAAGGQLKAWDHGQEDSCWPPRLHAPPPSAQHGLRPVVGQSLGLGHGQDSPTVSDQVVPPPLPLAPPPSVADASPAAPFPARSLASAPNAARHCGWRCRAAAAVHACRQSRGAGEP